MWRQALRDDAADPHGQGAAQFGSLRPRQAFGQALDNRLHLLTLSRLFDFYQVYRTPGALVRAGRCLCI